jgi:hypothetical protein
MLQQSREQNEYTQNVMGLLVPLRGRDHRAATVGVPQKLVAASHTHSFEPGAKQSSDEPLAPPGRAR